MKILGPHEQTKDKELMGDVCEPIENRWRTNEDSSRRNSIRYARFLKFFIFLAQFSVKKPIGIIGFFVMLLKGETTIDALTRTWKFKSFNMRKF